MLEAFGGWRSASGYKPPVGRTYISAPVLSLRGTTELIRPLVLPRFSRSSCFSQSYKTSFGSLSVASQASLVPLSLLSRSSLGPRSSQSSEEPLHPARLRPSTAAGHRFSRHATPAALEAAGRAGRSGAAARRPWHRVPLSLAAAPTERRQRGRRRQAKPAPRVLPGALDAPVSRLRS